MSKHLIRSVLAVVVLGLAVAATAYARPVVITLGNLVLTVDGGFSPTALPKHELAPIGFRASGSLETLDGSHPPAVTKASFDIDRDVGIDVSDFQVCRRNVLEARTSAAAKQACPGAILGEGTATVEIAFEEQQPFRASGPLVLFNGGVKNGVTTFYVQAYVSIPAPTAIVTTTKLTHTRNGPYGLHLESTVPTIAGGAGSIVAFELGASRFLTYKGKKRSFAFARCADGAIKGRGTIGFGDGTKMAGSIVRPCTVKN